MSNEIIKIQGDLSPVGWRAPDNLSQEGWQSIGGAIGKADKMIGWVIGDWLNAYPGEWGSMYDEAERLTGKSAKTLEELKGISASVKIPERSGILTIHHHRQVTKFRNEPDRQTFWLDLAERESWSARTLHEAIKEDEKPKPKLEPQPEPEPVSETGMTEDEARAVINKMETIMHSMPPPTKPPEKQERSISYAETPQIAVGEKTDTSIEFVEEVEYINLPFNPEEIACKLKRELTSDQISELIALLLEQ